MKVAINLLWMVPGGVGGSEEYVTRQIAALAEEQNDELTLFTLPGFSEAHPHVADRCRVVVAPTSGRRRVMRVVAEATWLRRAMAGTKYDAVHHAGGTVPVGSRQPVVLTMHDIQYLVFPDTFGATKLFYLRRAVPAAIRRARVIVTPSQYVADTLSAAFSVSADRLMVAPNAAPVAVQPPTAVDLLRTRYDLPGRVVLYPAITYRHKNHETLLAAMQPLMRAEPGLRLVLLGGVGPNEAAVLAEADRLGIAANVVRPGRVPAADRDGMYLMASALAFPSRYEGFGIPVLEAMTAGCPVVASATTALPETVGAAGLLVEPDDVDAWTVALDTVLSDPESSEDLRQRGYRRAAEFSAARSAARLRQAYAMVGDHR